MSDCVRAARVVSGGQQFIARRLILMKSCERWSGLSPVSLCVWTTCERGTFWTENHSSRIWYFHLVHFFVWDSSLCVGCCKALRIRFQYFLSVFAFDCFTVNVMLYFEASTQHTNSSAPYPPHRRGKLNNGKRCTGTVLAWLIMNPVGTFLSEIPSTQMWLWSPTHLLVKPFVYEGQPIWRKLA